MNRRDEPIICYIDSVDFDYELGKAQGGTMVYESPEDIRAERPCVREHGCGIVKVEVRFIEEVQPENLKFEEASPGFMVSGHMRSKMR